MDQLFNSLKELWDFLVKNCELNFIFNFWIFITLTPGGLVSSSHHNPAHSSHHHSAQAPFPPMLAFQNFVFLDKSKVRTIELNKVLKIGGFRFFVWPNWLLPVSNAAPFPPMLAFQNPNWILPNPIILWYFALYGQINFKKYWMYSSTPNEAKQNEYDLELTTKWNEGKERKNMADNQMQDRKREKEKKVKSKMTLNETTRCSIDFYRKFFFLQLLHIASL